MAGLCLLILLGWLGHLPLLTGHTNGGAATSMPTALGFIAAAAALWRRAGRPSNLHDPAAIAGALAIILFAIWVLADYGTGRPDAGLLFGPDYGRVAPATATCFLLLGAVLLGMGRPALGFALSLVTAVGLVLCALALATYLYDARALYRIDLFAAMALPTALIFSVLFTGVLLAQPFPGWMGYIVSRSSGGHMARRLLPAVILVPFLFGWAVADTGLGNPEATFGHALMAVSTAALLTVVVCIVSASLARGDTNLRKANDILRDSEQAARAIADTALDAFIQTDEDGRIQEWNRSAETLFGWSRPEALGRQIDETIMTPALRDEVRQARQHFLATGETTFLGRRVEREMVNRSGGSLSVEMSSTAIPQQNGLLFNFFIRDLTTKNTVEAQLRQAQKMEAVGNLTGGMAHDFNNILGVIIGNLDLLEDRLPGNAEVREIFGDALGAALSGSELTRRLLAFARRQPLAPQVIDINALVRGMLPLVRQALGETIALQLAPAPGLWPVKVDPAQLEAAILNLCTNARDAMQQSGRLTIATHNGHLDADYAVGHPDADAGDYAIIEITDTGCGMSKDVAEKIFEPFFTTKAQGKGTGLGLSMVFGFIRQSGGHVNVYSEPGIGTTFRLYLPRHVTDAPLLPAASEMPRSETAGRGETVLVVEDNADVRQVVLRQLDSLGYRTLDAADTSAALAILAVEHVDLLFSDVVMPGAQNGLDLAWIVRERWPQVAILLTSGFPEAHAREQDNRLSGFALLSKPYRKTELAKALRLTLSSGQLDAPVGAR